MASEKNYSLSQLLSSIRRCIEGNYTNRYWLRAEMSDFRSSANGHAYLELLEREEQGRQIKAKVRASIWSSVYPNILQKFRANGIEQLSSGMSILAHVQVSFHEQYGLNLIIWDIDPSYSLGAIARLRLETIEKLRKNGLLELNKSFVLPMPLQRLAIISSATAAGYGDFMKHLKSRSQHLYCSTALFSASMQGEQTTESISQALDKIYQNLELFDAVLVIRGGGAVSELRAFDDYRLCELCANFPLPILTGIGHERDQSVLDMVAHTSLKTPTAVADFILQSQEREFLKVEYLKERLIRAYSTLSVNRMHELKLIQKGLPNMARNKIKEYYYIELRRRNKLSRIAQYKLQHYKQYILQIQHRLPILSKAMLEQHRHSLSYHKQRLKAPIQNHLRRLRTQIEHLDQSIRLSKPEEILKRGFAIIRHEGKIKTKVATLKQGDKLSIQLNKSYIEAEVRELKGE